MVKKHLQSPGFAKASRSRGQAENGGIPYSDSLPVHARIRAFFGRGCLTTLLLIVPRSSLLSNGISVEIESESLREAWKETTIFLFNDARRRFRDLRLNKHSNEPMVRLGEAVNLLNVQPKTRGNIEQARQHLESLAQDGAHDEIALMARYFIARIEQIHDSAGDPMKAATIYRRLLREQPDHWLAQQGAVKLGMLLLFESDPSVDRGPIFAEVEAFGPILTSRAARRDFHHLLGRAYLFFEASREKALAHLMAAEAEGMEDFSLRADVLVSIAELARELDRREVAIRYYEAFLEDHLRDYRSHLVALRLQDLREKVAANDH